MTALFGEELYTGDVVEFYNTRTGKKFSRFVSKHYGKYRIGALAIPQLCMGIWAVFQIRKVKSYKDLQDGKEYNCIKYVK